MRARSLIGVLLLSFPAEAAAETVTWESSAVSPGVERRILGRGAKQYSPATDIVVREGRSSGGRPTWAKSLVLDDSFALTASVHREPALEGFGLYVDRRDEGRGFSWEWFERAQGNVFLKLQGEGRVSVRVRKGTGYEELESIEFLDDVVLRYLDDMSKPPGTVTHELVVRKGSVLTFAP